VDFGEPYARALRQAVLSAAADAQVAMVDGGCYGATQGPRLETRAEITRMRRDGCDLVGMTGMPEAGLAREMGWTTRAWRSSPIGPPVPAPTRTKSSPSRTCSITSLRPRRIAGSAACIAGTDLRVRMTHISWLASATTGLD